jgi:hypothetical protein
MPNAEFAYITAPSALVGVASPRPAAKETLAKGHKVSLEYDYGESATIEQQAQIAVLTGPPPYRFRR